MSLLSSYIFISNFIESPLEAFGVAYNLAYFLSFLILVIMFLKDTHLKFSDLFILKFSDIEEYKNILLKVTKRK